MAERRMLSKKITNADEFLELPPTTQILYIHLCMEADDDGFIGGVKSVVRRCAGKPEDLKQLIKKKYIISFKSGVVAIRHWRVHNQIRRDRYHETYYQDEFLSLTIDEQGVYRELPKQTPVSSQNSLATEVRIGKERLEQIRQGQPSRGYPGVSASSAALEQRIMEGRASLEDLELYRALYGRRPDMS